MQNSIFSSRDIDTLESLLKKATTSEDNEVQQTQLSTIIDGFVDLFDEQRDGQIMNHENTRKNIQEYDIEKMGVQLGKLNIQLHAW